MRSLSLACLFGLTTVAAGAPGRPDQPPKWEYAELMYRPIPGRPPGLDPDGKPVDAAPPSVTVRWTTAADELMVTGWDTLATRLKLAGVQENTTATHQRLQVLNALGSAGWELIDQHTPPPAAGRGGYTPTTWLLKRRVP